MVVRRLAGGARARRRVLARAAHARRPASSTASPTRSPAAATPSGCACPTNRSRSSCCTTSAAGSRRPRRTGSAASARRRPTTCAPISATTSTWSSTADRATSASSRRSSTAAATSPRSCASAVCRSSGSRRSSGRAFAQRTDGEVAAPGTLAAHYAPAAQVVRRRRGCHRRARLRRCSPAAAGSVSSPRRRCRRSCRRAWWCSNRPPTSTTTRTCCTPDSARPTSVRWTSSSRCHRRRRVSAPRSADRLAGRTRERPMSEPITLGVFDSGLGGLTVLRSLIDLAAGRATSSTSATPGGSRTARSRPTTSSSTRCEIADVLVDRGAQALVVACNSASAVALDQLRENVAVPVVGVIEPGLRAAARVTQNGRVGVIGTVGTIASGAYQRAVGAPRARSRAHVRGVPRLRRVRRGGRRRLGPGARARRATARAGARRPVSTRSCSAARTTPCLPVRSAT